MSEANEKPDNGKAYKQIHFPVFHPFTADSEPVLVSSSILAISLILLYILHMKKPIAIIQNTEVESAGSILEWLTQQQLPYTVIHSYKQQQLPDINAIGAVIVLGCPYSVQEYKQHDFLKNLFAFISKAVRTDLPYLGLCFGAQMLAAVLGSRVKPNPVKEIGTYRVTLTDTGRADSIFQGFDDSFDVFQWHGDTFDVPFGAQLLVEGEQCKNQAFRKGNAVGLQFHLEALAEDVPRWCTVNHEELLEFGRSKDEITIEYQQVAKQAQENNFRLLENFFHTIA